MANATKGNVLILDTDNYTLDGPVTICGIKWIAAGTTPSAAIRADKESSGQIVWESNVAAGTEIYENVDLRIPGGIYVDLAGSGSKLYLYLEIE